MPTAAEPVEAVLPLPGGREGATVRLHPLLAGEMKGPPAWFHREEGRLARMHAFGIRVPRERFLRVPVQAFLVEHPQAGHVLVDTGFHPSVASDPPQNLGRAAGFVFKEIKLEPSDAVPAQLRRRGTEPGDIKVVVMTHLHNDHASAMSEFPNATFVFGKAEWEAATRPRGQLHGYVRRQFDHAFDYRTLDFEDPRADSFATFGRSYDLFGDGSVRLVSTPGHTDGHLSVVLRLGSREALLAGDAIYTMRTLRESHLPAEMADEHRFTRSLSEIQLYAKETPTALIVPGHDWDAFQALDPLYV